MIGKDLITIDTLDLRNQALKCAARNFVCPNDDKDNPPDMLEAYDILSEGDPDNLISIWEPFDNYDKKEIAEFIENLALDIFRSILDIRQKFVAI